MDGSNDTKRKLIVVLGSHRTGTSAIARALPIFGAEMGNSLLPPDYRNEKGYWEDQDIKSFNDSLLQTIDSRWDHISIVPEDDYRRLNRGGLVREAIELLREKSSMADIYGLKEPQITKLLPFWVKIFEESRLDYRLVVALRNPLSSAISLTKRDGLTRKHGYDLWFSQMVAAIGQPTAAPMVVVEYDRLLKNPEFEIERIGQSLNLSTIPDRLAIYRSEFLDTNLRHSQHSWSDLDDDPDCPAHVKQLYAVLHEQACLPGKVDQTRLLVASQSFSAVLADNYDEAQTFDARLRDARTRETKNSARQKAGKLARWLLAYLAKGKAIVGQFRS